METATVRETKEETGLKIRVTNFVGFKNTVIRERSGNYHVVLFCYEGVVRSGKLGKGNDVAEAAWKVPSRMARSSIAAPIMSFLGSRAPSQKS